VELEFWGKQLFLHHGMPGIFVTSLSNHVLYFSYVNTEVLMWKKLGMLALFLNTSFLTWLLDSIDFL